MPRPRNEQGQFISPRTAILSDGSTITVRNTPATFMVTQSESPTERELTRIEGRIAASEAAASFEFAPFESMDDLRSQAESGSYDANSCDCDACLTVRRYREYVSATGAAPRIEVNAPDFADMVRGQRLAIEQLSMQARAPMTMPADLITQPAEPRTPRDVQLKKLAEYGITEIPADECAPFQGSTGIVIWRNWQPREKVALSQRFERIWTTVESESYYSDRTAVLAAISRSPRRAHASKQVRIEGWGIRNGFYYHYHVTSTGRQCVAQYRPNGVLYDTNEPDHSVEIHSGMQKLEKAPLFYRSIALRDEITRLYNRNKISTDRYERAIEFASAPSPAAPKYEETIPLRGVRRARDMYARIKGAIHDMGATLAKMHIADEVLAREFIGAIDNYKYWVGTSSVVRNKINDMVQFWNDNCDSDFELINGTCGHLHFTSDSHATADGDVCETCFENRYSYAEDTEEYHLTEDLYCHDDDLYYTYSDDSDNENVGGRVQGYSTNVLTRLKADTSIVSSQYGDFLLGVELEVAPVDGRRKDPVLAMSDMTQGYAILKNDGSLPTGGFEIVTAPRGLKEHIERFKAWQPHANLRAWDNGKCGMHVHISSQAFSQTTLGKFLEFINSTHNDGMVKDIAGRHPNSDAGAKEYCRRDGQVFVGNPKKTLAGKETDRYRMVNSCNLSAAEAKRLGLNPFGINEKNYNTIELRIFRASLSKPRMLAQIEFAHAAVMFCRVASMRELGQSHFVTWLRGTAGQYPHLARWFGVRANTQVVEANPKVRETAEV